MDGPEDQGDPLLPFRCAECGKGFLTGQALGGHTQIHRRVYCARPAPRKRPVAKRDSGVIPVDPFPPVSHLLMQPSVPTLEEHSQGLGLQPHRGSLKREEPSVPTIDKNPQSLGLELHKGSPELKVPLMPARGAPGRCEYLHDGAAKGGAATGIPEGSPTAGVAGEVEAAGGIPQHFSAGTPEGPHILDHGDVATAFQYLLHQGQLPSASGALHPAAGAAAGQVAVADPPASLLEPTQTEAPSQQPPAPVAPWYARGAKGSPSVNQDSQAPPSPVPHWSISGRNASAPTGVDQEALGVPHLFPDVSHPRCLHRHASFEQCSLSGCGQPWHGDSRRARAKGPAPQGGKGATSGVPRESPSPSPGVPHSLQKGHRRSHSVPSVPKYSQRERKEHCLKAPQCPPESSSEGSTFRQGPTGVAATDAGAPLSRQGEEGPVTTPGRIAPQDSIASAAGALCGAPIAPAPARPAGPGTPLGYHAVPHLSGPDSLGRYEAMALPDGRASGAYKCGALTRPDGIPAHAPQLHPCRLAGTSTPATHGPHGTPLLGTPLSSQGGPAALGAQLGSRARSAPGTPGAPVNPCTQGSSAAHGAPGRGSSPAYAGPRRVKGTANEQGRDPKAHQWVSRKLPRRNPGPVSLLREREGWDGLSVDEISGEKGRGEGVSGEGKGGEGAWAKSGERAGRQPARMKREERPRPRSCSASQGPGEGGSERWSSTVRAAAPRGTSGSSSMAADGVPREPQGLLPEKPATVGAHFPLSQRPTSLLMFDRMASLLPNPRQALQAVARLETAGEGGHLEDRKAGEEGAEDGEKGMGEGGGFHGGGEAVSVDRDNMGMYHGGVSLPLLDLLISVLLHPPTPAHPFPSLASHLSLQPSLTSTQHPLQGRLNRGGSNNRALVNPVPDPQHRDRWTRFSTRATGSVEHPGTHPPGDLTEISAAPAFATSAIAMIEAHPSPLPASDQRTDFGARASASLGSQRLPGVPELQGLPWLPGQQGSGGLPAVQALAGVPALQGLRGLSGSSGMPELQGLQGLSAMQLLSMLQNLRQHEITVPGLDPASPATVLAPTGTQGGHAGASGAVPACQRPAAAPAPVVGHGAHLGVPQGGQDLVGGVARPSGKGIAGSRSGALAGGHAAVFPQWLRHPHQGLLQQAPRASQERSVRERIRGEGVSQTLPATPGQDPRQKQGHNPGLISGQRLGHNPGHNAAHHRGRNPGSISAHNPGQNPGHSAWHNRGNKPEQTPGESSGHIPGYNPANPGRNTAGHNPGQNPGHTTERSPGRGEGARAASLEQLRVAIERKQAALEAEKQAILGLLRRG